MEADRKNTVRKIGQYGRLRQGDYETIKGVHVLKIKLGIWDMDNVVLQILDHAPILERFLPFRLDDFEEGTYVGLQWIERSESGQIDIIESGISLLWPIRGNHACVIIPVPRDRDSTAEKIRDGVLYFLACFVESVDNALSMVLSDYVNNHNAYRDNLGLTVMQMPDDVYIFQLG